MVHCLFQGHDKKHAVQLWFQAPELLSASSRYRSAPWPLTLCPSAPLPICLNAVNDSVVGLTEPLTQTSMFSHTSIDGFSLDRLPQLKAFTFVPVSLLSFVFPFFHMFHGCFVWCMSQHLKTSYNVTISFPRFTCHLIMINPALMIIRLFTFRVLRAKEVKSWQFFFPLAILSSPWRDRVSYPPLASLILSTPGDWLTRSPSCTS